MLRFISVPFLFVLFTAALSADELPSLKLHEGTNKIMISISNKYFTTSPTYASKLIPP